MNALPPPNRPPQSHQPRRRVSKRRRQSLQKPHQSIATETTTKLGVNLLLSFIAVTALVKLLPYNMAQQKSFEELQSKVVEVENRVENLQTDFNHHFDPKQARSVMQQESTRIEPGQRQIVWIAPQRATAQQPTAPNNAPVAQESGTPNAEAAFPEPISVP
jgi:cell division protein FtsB